MSLPALTCDAEITFPIHGPWREPRMPIATGTSARDISPADENVVSSRFQPTGNAHVEAAIAAEDKDTHQARPERPSRRSGDPIRPLTISAWIVVAGQSFEIGPINRSRMNGSIRLSD